MTIAKLYERAKEWGCEDYEIVIPPRLEKDVRIYISANVADFNAITGRVVLDYKEDL